MEIIKKVSIVTKYLPIVAQVALGLRGAFTGHGYFGNFLTRQGADNSIPPLWRPRGYNASYARRVPSLGRAPRYVGRCSRDKPNAASFGKSHG